MRNLLFYSTVLHGIWNVPVIRIKKTKTESFTRLIPEHHTNRRYLQAEKIMHLPY